MQCLSSSLLCQRRVPSKNSRSPSMATTVNLSPLHTALCPRRCVVTFFLPRLSSYSPPKPSSVASLSISSRPRSTRPTGPRALTIASAAMKPLSDSELLAVPPSAQDLAGKFPSDSGVYAVFGIDGDIQFIGISRNIAASFLFHRKSVPELCCSVKIGLVDDADRTMLTQAWKSWMEEQIRTTGKVPPGNETGNTTWIWQPPVKKADLRLTPGQHVQLTLPLEDIIDRLVKKTKVVAFIKGSRSAPLCGFSQKVVGILTSEGVDFESVDVLDEEYNHGLREALKKYSKWPTFPQIFVNGELVGGCDILTSMQEKGELAGFFLK